MPAFGTDDHLYLKARAFFADSTREYVLENGQVEPERMNAIADALSTLFKLVVIDLEDNDDAQVIFEVLNGRQTPLSAIDLVKNLLFLRGELAADDVEALYDKYWAHFDDAWWKEVVGRGDAARGRRDVLLSVWLAARPARKQVWATYMQAPAPTSTTDQARKSAQEGWRRTSAAYEAIYSHAGVAEVHLKTAYERIQRLEIATAVPLLAWLRTLPTTSLNS